MSIGDIVLFLKSEQEYDLQYQYGMLSQLCDTKDGHVRTVEIEYVNYKENTRRKTRRGVRNIVIIHPIEELDLYQELGEIFS